MKKLFYILPLLFILFSCSDSNDEPIAIDYRLSSENQDIAIIDNGRKASLNVPGFAAKYTISISGDFVNIVLNSNAEWLSADYSNGIISINATKIEINDGDSRTGNINFTVFNDTKSSSGEITITQRVITYDDLRNYENNAINFFLSKHEVIKQIPTDNNFQFGDDAPFYILSSDPIVAMKVINNGSDIKPNDKDYVYFRFSRADINRYYQTGELIENFSPSFSTSSFIYNDFSTSASAQWGKAIQMPFQYGLGYNSKVELVVASPLGIVPEISYVTPYIYTVSYYKGEY